MVLRILVFGGFMGPKDVSRPSSAVTRQAGILLYRGLQARSLK